MSKPTRSLRDRLHPVVSLLRAGGSKQKAKHDAELSFWTSVQEDEGELRNDHYESFFTAALSIERSFYAGKRILDIGCGPRGSLEWAGDAAQRVGLDPLVPSYRSFGIDGHAMEYVATGSETIPFPDEHFDVVSSFNSLDHVDDLDATITEIKRVLKPGGLMLLITEVNHAPTVTEPIGFSWAILEQFRPECEVVDEWRFEKLDAGVYQSVEHRTPYTGDAGDHAGVLVAKLRRR